MSDDDAHPPVSQGLSQEPHDVRIIALPSLPVKPTRKSPRPSAPFGAGILPHAGRRMPYTQADLDEAVLMFADSPEPDWDAMALEAEHQARLDAMAPATYGRC
jgi:hypothetical protein